MVSAPPIGYQILQTEAPQGFDNAFDLLFALFVGAAESRGERGGVGSGFGAEGADQGDLGGSLSGQVRVVETGLTAPLISAEGRAISVCSSTGVPASVELGL